MFKRFKKEFFDDENITLGQMAKSMFRYALCVTPVGVTLNYGIQVNKYNKVCQMQEQMQALNGLNRNLPYTYDQYQRWIDTASLEELQSYNNKFAQVKKEGKCSDYFLYKHNYDSSQDFKSDLSNLYNLGKEGDLTAQQSFTDLQADYQDDMFYQTAVMCGMEPFYTKPAPIAEPFMIGGIDSIDDINLGLIAAGAVGVAVCVAAGIAYIQSKSGGKSK